MTRAIENAQRKVEARNFDMRKQLLEYDDVANDQRKVIYQQRNELLEATDVAETIAAMRTDIINDTIALHIPRRRFREKGYSTVLENVQKKKSGLVPAVKKLVEKTALKQEANVP